MNRTEASPAQLAAFAAALDEALVKHGWSDGVLGEKAAAEMGGPPLTKQAISNYRRGLREPHRATVFAFERALGMKPGRLSQHLGYLPVTGGRRS